MGKKGAAAEKRAQTQQANQKKSWKQYAKASSKHYVDRQMKQHPQLSMEIEKFVRSKSVGA